MDTPYAFVTLVTSDHYLPGALAVAAALKDQHPSHLVPHEVAFQTLCIVTPESVDVSTIKLLRRAFDIVIGVEIIEQEDGTGLQLLGESCGPLRSLALCAELRCTTAGFFAQKTNARPCTNSMQIYTLLVHPFETCSQTPFLNPTCPHHSIITLHEEYVLNASTSRSSGP